jgi:hypothetical protein
MPIPLNSRANVLWRMRCCAVTHHENEVINLKKNMGDRWR